MSHSVHFHHIIKFDLLILWSLLHANVRLILNIRISRCVSLRVPGHTFILGIKVVLFRRKRKGMLLDVAKIS